MQRRREAALALMLAAAGTACTLGARTDDLQGQVLAIDRERREVLISHEAIPDVMPAMTMPFRVEDAAILDGARPGDLIRARLVIRGADARLASLDRIGTASITAEGAAPAPTRVALLQPGDLVPAARFVDQDGRARTVADWRGRATALTFIYTRCPLPTFCPLVDRRFAALQRTIAGDASLRGRVRLVSISFDPAYDTPEILRAHAAALDADPEVWTFLTGAPDDIDRFALRFGVGVTRDDAATFTHTLSTAVLGPDGTLAALHAGTEWTPRQVLDELAAVVSAP
jgi:protein SCO1/2